MKTIIYGIQLTLMVMGVINMVSSSESMDDINYNNSEAIYKRIDDLQNYCENKIKELEETMRESRVQKRSVFGSSVAFSTLLTRNQEHIGISQTIKYDNVLLNDGNGYSTHTGTFTAPSDGVYMFTYFFGHGYAAGQVWLELMHNGRKINAGVTDPYHEWQDLQGGNVAIIRVNAGDEVWIEAFHQNDATLYGINGFTTFSGILLY